MSPARPPALSFTEAFDLYLSLRTPYLSESSIDSIRDTKKSFLRSMQDLHLADYSGILLLQYVRCLIERKRKPTGINLDLRNLKAFGNWCEKQGLLPRDNPFSSVEQLKVAVKPIRFLTSEEVQSILAVEPSPLLRKIYLVALLTGQRVSDVIKMQWDQIDVERRIMRTLNTKANRLGTLPLHSALCEVLIRDGVKKEGPLFSGRRGEKITSGYVSHAFKRAARAADIEDVTFHVLRKTFASWLAISGVGLHDIQKLLGHSSVTLTEKYYACLVSTGLQDAVARLSFAPERLPQFSVSQHP